MASTLSMDRPSIASYAAAVPSSSSASAQGWTNSSLILCSSAIFFRISSWSSSLLDISSGASGLLEQGLTAMTAYARRPLSPGLDPEALCFALAKVVDLGWFALCFALSDLERACFFM